MLCAKKDKAFVGHKVAILAVDGCIGSTVHGLLDAFACANACAADQRADPVPFSVFVVSPDGSPAIGYNGHKIAVAGSLRSAEGSEIILLAPIMPATTPPIDHGAKIGPLYPVLPWLRRQAEAGACIATSCTGSFLLAEAGLLDGKIATTHWRAAQAFRERYPSVVLRENELVTEDGSLVCSGGAVSYIDLALHLIRRFVNSALALQCARMLVVDPGRDRQSPYRAFEPNKAHGDEKIVKAQKWLDQHYWEDVDITSLARQLAMSPRNLNRRFKSACGETVTSYLRALRIAAACDRLVTGDAPVQQIIHDVGYSDGSSFGRLFKETIGITMGEYRSRFQVSG